MTGPGTFEADGYALGRQVFDPNLLRQVREPLVDALIADGHVARVADDDDQFRWVGDPEAFSRFAYEPVLRRGAEQSVMATGAAGWAIEAMFGRRGALWERVQLAVSVPGGTLGAPHRDAQHFAGPGEPGDDFRLWCPLTRIGEGDGGLEVAVGSHRRPDGPATVAPPPQVLHEYIPQFTSNYPPDAEFTWYAPPYALGDAIIFRPDVLHRATANTNGRLRLALLLSGQDDRLPLAADAGLSLDSWRSPTTVEWLALAIFAVQPTSVWHLRCAFYPRGVIGRTWFDQPSERVERCVETLQARGAIEPDGDDNPASGLHRRFRATAAGHDDVRRWLSRPVPVDDPAGDRLAATTHLLRDWLGGIPTTEER